MNSKAFFPLSHKLQIGQRKPQNKPLRCSKLEIKMWYSPDIEACDYLPDALTIFVVGASGDLVSAVADYSIRKGRVLLSWPNPV